MRLQLGSLPTLCAFFVVSSPAQPVEGFTALLGEGDVATIRSGPGGSIYVLGASDSSELPTRRAFQPELAPGDCDGRPLSEAPCPDLFLAKLAGDGELLYLTYLGGSGPERAIDLQVDDDGAAYVLGRTESADFPETARVRPPPESFVGAFLAKVAPDGSALLEAVRLPGEPAALALAGQAPVLVGATNDPEFPVVGEPPAAISDSALFVRSIPDGEVLVRNAGLRGPVIKVAVGADRVFALANDVFVSSDNGASWTASGHEAAVDQSALESMPRRRIAIAPDDLQTVYATAQGRLLRTRDGGASWTDATPPAMAEGSSFTPEPVGAGAGGRAYTAAYFGRMVRSDDFGDTWGPIENSSYVIRILVDSSNPDLVYAQRSEPHSFGAGLRFSADGGQTWEERTFPTHSFGRQLGAKALLLDPGDSAHLYGLFSDRLHESIDGGATWSALGVLGPDARAVRLSAMEPGVLHGLARSGVLRSEDGGRTWERVEGFFPRDYTDIAVDRRGTSRLYVSARGSRVDGFLMGLKPDLRSIAFSTKLGGFGADRPQSLSVEPTGDILIGGVTDSADFPSAVPYGGGETDFFLARLSPPDWTLSASMLLGGSQAEQGLKLAPGPDGTVYFAGASASSDFPALRADSRPPTEAADPLFGAVDSGLERSLFARHFDTPWGGCFESMEVAPGRLELSGSAGADCEGNPAFGVGTTFVATTDLEGAAVESAMVPFESLAAGVARFEGGFTLAGERWLGPSTALSTPAGPPEGAVGAYVVRFDGGGPVSEPRVAAVVDAAAYTGGPLAPGLIASLFGSSLGPAEGATFGLVDGKLPTELASTRVLINGRPAAMLFARDDQVNFIASFVLEPRTTAKLEVETATGRSERWYLPVSVSHLGLFSSEGLGRGFLVAINQDGSLNTEENPAAIGSVVSVFGVGAGAMSPPMEDGSIAPLALPLPKPALDLSLTVGERPAEVLYAGAAPGLAAGVIQINFRVADGLGPSGALPVEVQIGEKRFGRGSGLYLRVPREF